MTDEPFILALPKGRILKDLEPLLDAIGLEPEPAFHDDRARQLRFKTNQPGVEIIRVRSFDVATFVAHGAAHLGVAGLDVILEFNHPNVYAPIDLGIGACRLSVAGPAVDDDRAAVPNGLRGGLRVATKYPNLTRAYYDHLGVNTVCVKLNGAMELAPGLMLSPRIVDLVSSGSTLRANGLTEIETIMNITSHLVVNRDLMLQHGERLSVWIDQFRSALEQIQSKPNRF